MIYSRWFLVDGVRVRLETPGRLEAFGYGVQDWLNEVVDTLIERVMDFEEEWIAT